jgi:hypothetical protein
MSERPQDRSGRKRRWHSQFLIYPSFQLKLIAIQLGAASLTLGLAWVWVGRAFAELREQARTANFSEDHPYFELLQFQEHRIFTSLLAAFAIGTALATVINLKLTQRLAGPIVRLRGYFAALRPGEPGPPPLTFREGDFFEELPIIINSALGAAEPVDSESEAA